MSVNKIDHNLQLTEEGYNSLKQEYTQLNDVDRPNIIRQVEEARKQGDLRENEAYHAARHKQALIQGRLEELEHILKNAQVVSVDQSRKDIVQIGTTVKISGNGQEKELMLVGEQEADINVSKISAQSPLGQALMGKRVGDLIQVEVPAGSVEYTVISVN